MTVGQSDAADVTHQGVTEGLDVRAQDEVAGAKERLDPVTHLLAHLKTGKVEVHGKYLQFVHRRQTKIGATPITRRGRPR